mmetsp:Transcript_96945/g.313021  ORF Transcript_96945/g.313021 Transcript_96945/m.313021 type:complete len:568 (-) Transcript_96945:233-1936(-)
MPFGTRLAGDPPARPEMPRGCHLVRFRRLRAPSGQGAAPRPPAPAAGLPASRHYFDQRDGLVERPRDHAVVRHRCVHERRQGHVVPALAWCDHAAGLVDVAEHVDAWAFAGDVPPKVLAAVPSIQDALRWVVGHEHVDVGRQRPVAPAVPGAAVEPQALDADERVVEVCHAGKQPCGMLCLELAEWPDVMVASDHELRRMRQAGHEGVEGTDLRLLALLREVAAMDQHVPGWHGRRRDGGVQAVRVAEADDAQPAVPQSFDQDPADLEGGRGADGQGTLDGRSHLLTSWRRGHVLRRASGENLAVHLAQGREARGLQRQRRRRDQPVALELWVDADELALPRRRGRQDFLTALAERRHAQAAADLYDGKPEAGVGAQSREHGLPPSAVGGHTQCLLVVHEAIAVAEEEDVRPCPAAAAVRAAGRRAAVPAGNEVGALERRRVEERVAAAASLHQREALATGHAPALPPGKGAVDLAEGLRRHDAAPLEEAVDVGCQGKGAPLGAPGHGVAPGRPCLDARGPVAQDSVALMGLRLLIAARAHGPEAVEELRVLEHGVAAGCLVVGEAA